MDDDGDGMMLRDDDREGLMMMVRDADDGECRMYDDDAYAHLPSPTSVYSTYANVCRQKVSTSLSSSFKLVGLMTHMYDGGCKVNNNRCSCWR